MSTGYESIDEERITIWGIVEPELECIKGERMQFLAYLAFFDLQFFMSLEPASNLSASGSFSFSLYILHLRYLTDL